MIDFSPMKKKQDTPKVGVGVFIEKDEKILMMLRSGSHRTDTWALPGGHIDLGENFIQTCRREIREELGIYIDAVERFDFVNTIFEDEGLHYVTLYFKAIWDDIQQPTIMEPEKIQELKWVHPDSESMPQNIFSENAKQMIIEYGRRQQASHEKLWREIYWERG